ncbi:MAG: TIM barrel protein [Aureliella sp.]
MVLAQETRVEEKQSEETVPKNLQTEQLVAWCIVPFDAAERGPVERAEMLRELGLRRLAYDWREKHVPSWPAELKALAEHDIELTSFWCSASLSPASDPGAQRILKFLRKHKVTTQLWVMLPDHELAKIDDESQRVARAAEAIRQLAEPAGEIGCQVGLYNHGGWIGRPDTLVKVIHSLDDLSNVGIVYNFHHAHDDLDAFPAALRNMKPYLLCLNLNGTTVGGPKIQTFGDGELDAQILGWIREAKYTGPVGILDHRNELDARDSLLSNLQGLRKLLETD